MTQRAERVAWYVALQLIAGAVAFYSSHISPVYFYTHWGYVVFALHVPDAWLGIGAHI